MSRTESSAKNLITALVGQAVGIAVSFVARIVFLRILNEEYLGLNGLFTNILTIFSLVELGVGPAMNFSLYKPLARHDTAQVKSLMALYKKAYVAIGCAIGLIGLLFTPFYTVFMDEVPDIPHLTAIYWLFTANTAVSYFFSYKRALIICDERRYIATIYRYAFYCALNVVQIVFLIATHDYILYLTLQVLFTVGENIGVSRKADRMYPYLRERDAGPVPAETAADIRKNIRAMLMHKVGSMVVLSTDNLILSKFVGLTAVGLYSNYYLITDALNKVITQFFTSATASVGNLNASDAPEDRRKLEKVFDRIFFMDFWIYGFSCCCLWGLFNPFISLWLGDWLLFDPLTVGIIVVNFYLSGMRKTGSIFREATGAFYYDRYKAVAEAAVNIVASVILAKRMGAAGVFLGTIVSTLTTCLWVEPYVLYKHVFQKSVRSFWRQFAEYTLASALACLLTTGLLGVLPAVNVYADFLAKAAVCLILPNLLFLALFGRREEFRYYVTLGKRLCRRLLSRGR